MSGLLMGPPTVVVIFIFLKVRLLGVAWCGGSRLFFQRLALQNLGIYIYIYMDRHIARYTDRHTDQTRGSNRGRPRVHRPAPPSRRHRDQIVCELDLVEQKERVRPCTCACGQRANKQHLHGVPRQSRAVR